MNQYKILKKQEFFLGDYSITPLRMEDRWDIMTWRNEQIYHLRQNKPLTVEDQDNYFNTIIANLFQQENPNQVLFSFLKEKTCIGYGGLVHINWIDKNAEISFIMDTSLEKNMFSEMWTIFLQLIEKVAFDELNFHKIFTYAFNLRPHLYPVLEKNNFRHEATLSEHCIYEDQLIDVLIHSKVNNAISLKKASLADIRQTYKWACDATIRQYSFNKNAIAFEDHENWFLQKINNEYCSYFILKKGLKSVGSIRVDYNEDFSEGTISYLIDPENHGQSLGQTIVEKIETAIFSENKINEITLIGFVKNENIASIKIFKKLNYRETENKNETLKFEKKISNENSK